MALVSPRADSLRKNLLSLHCVKSVLHGQLLGRYCRESGAKIND
jgi:hypothetical protein